MARKAVACTVQSRLANGQSTIVGHAYPVDPINASATATDQAAVAAAVATLVADAASPTQAHVTTLNSAWGTLAADIAPVPGVSDVVISYNATTVVSRDTLRQAVDQLLAILLLTL